MALIFSLHFNPRIFISEILLARETLQSFIQACLPRVTDMYLPGTVLGTGDVSVSRTNEHLALVGHAFQQRKANKEGFSVCRFPCDMRTHQMQNLEGAGM